MSTETENALIASGFAAGENLPTAPADRAAVPFVVFLSPKSEKLWPRASAAIPGVKEGEPILFPEEPYPPIRLNPFVFVLHGAYRFWGSYNDGGELLKARETDPKDKAWTETVEAMLIVLNGANLTPARATFKSTKCPAVNKAIFAANDAGSAKWAAAFPGTVKAIPAEFARYRFITTVAVSKQTIKTGPRAGGSYYRADGTVTPIADAGAKLLMDFVLGPGKPALAALQAAYDKRLKDVADKIVAS